MIELRQLAVRMTAMLLCMRLVGSALFAAEPGGPADVIRSFSDLVDRAAESAEYLEAEHAARIRIEAEKIFPLLPSVSSKEAARMDREGEKAFLAEELRKEFPVSDTEIRHAMEKEAETLFPLYEKGEKVNVSYRFGKYHASGVYYGKKGEYLQIGRASVPIQDLSEEELRKFDPARNKEVRSAYILEKCREYTEKKQSAARTLKVRWDSGRDDRRFKLGFFRFSQKWYTGEQLLEELIDRKNREFLQALKEKAEHLAQSGDFSGADQILQDFLTRHPALTSELEPIREKLRLSAGEDRCRAALKEAEAMSDPAQAQAFLEKFLAGDPDSPGSAKIRSAIASLEIRAGEQKKCRETIESARKLEPEDACALLEHFMSEYAGYSGMDEVNTFYQARKKEGERKRCARILDSADRAGSEEEAVRILEQFLEDQPECDGIEAVREALRKRQARLEENGNGI